MTQQLTKSKQKIIAGVCGGIAKWIGWDPTLVRILYILLSVISAGFPGTIVYIILWVIMPKPEDNQMPDINQS